jgi:hypothetical protein
VAARPIVRPISFAVALSRRVVAVRGEPVGPVETRLVAGPAIAIVVVLLLLVVVVVVGRRRRGSAVMLRVVVLVS